VTLLLRSTLIYVIYLMKFLRREIGVLHNVPVSVLMQKLIHSLSHATIYMCYIYIYIYIYLCVCARALVLLTSWLNHIQLSFSMKHIIVPYPFPLFSKYLLNFFSIGAIRNGFGVWVRRSQSEVHRVRNSPRRSCCLRS